MNILIIAQEYMAGNTVAAYRMTELTEYLVNKGENVSVVRRDFAFHKVKQSDRNLNDKVKIYEVKEIGNYFEIAHLYERKVIQILEKEKFEVMIASCGPYTLELFLPVIKQKYNIPYILDFRDLWIYGNESVSNNKLKQFVQYTIKKRIEKRAVKKADRVVTVVPGDKELIRTNYHLKENKIDVIYNGFNDTKLNKLEKISLEDGFQNIGAYGKFSYYAPQYLDRLLETIDKINSKGYKLRIFHMGSKETYVEERINKLGLNPMIYHYEGYIKYEEGMKLLQNMICNIILQVHPVGLGTKFFDYIFLNKPIIVLGNKDTYLSKIVRNFEGGFACDCKEELEETFMKILECKIKQFTDEEVKSKYSRSSQNEKYCLLIKNIVKEYAYLD